MNTRIDPARLQAISSCLSLEIYRPLDSLQAGLNRLLDDPTRLPSEVERDHALTMLSLCEDLRRLTRECLGEALGVKLLEEDQTTAPLSKSTTA